MQLLQITVTPTRYELEIERAKLEYKQDFQPGASVQTTPPELKINTENGVMRLDTYEARKSLGFATIGDRIKTGAENGKRAILETMRERADMGNQMSNIHEGVTIGDIVKQKMQQTTPTQTVFIPSSGASMSYEPSEIRMSYQKGKTDYDWDIKRNSMSYVPGSVKLKIIEKGGIDVEYMGSPIYFPRSADPNYKEPAAG